MDISYFFIFVIPSYKNPLLNTLFFNNTTTLKIIKKVIKKRIEHKSLSEVFLKNRHLLQSFKSVMKAKYFF
jgi:hypothetical protein